MKLLLPLAAMPCGDDALEAKCGVHFLTAAMRCRGRVLGVGFKDGGWRPCGVLDLKNVGCWPCGMLDLKNVGCWPCGVLDLKNVGCWPCFHVELPSSFPIKSLGLCKFFLHNLVFTFSLRIFHLLSRSYFLLLLSSLRLKFLGGFSPILRRPPPRFP